MKIRIELEIDLGNGFLDSDDEVQRVWLFNEVLNKTVLSLYSKEVGDDVGKIYKVVKCEEIKD